MGMIGRIIGGALGAKLLHGAMNRNTAGSAQYIPAADPTGTALQPANPAGDLVGRARDYYAQNPKLVHTVGAAAVAIALASFARKRGVL
jgi:hypothetical protein